MPAFASLPDGRITALATLIDELGLASAPWSVDDAVVTVSEIAEVARGRSAELPRFGLASYDTESDHYVYRAFPDASAMELEVARFATERWGYVVAAFDLDDARAMGIAATVSLL